MLLVRSDMVVSVRGGANRIGRATRRVEHTLTTVNYSKHEKKLVGKWVVRVSGI